MTGKNKSSTDGKNTPNKRAKTGNNPKESVQTTNVVESLLSNETSPEIIDNNDGKDGSSNNDNYIT